MEPSRIPEAQAWLEHLAADLQASAALTDPDARDEVLGRAKLHLSFIETAVARESEECAWAADRDLPAPVMAVVAQHQRRAA